MQVWLVLVALFCVMREREAASKEEHTTESAFWMLLGVGLVIVSVVLVFVNGGTTG